VLLFIYFVIQVTGGHVWRSMNSVDCGEMMLLCLFVAGFWISCVPYTPMLRASGPYVRMWHKTVVHSSSHGSSLVIFRFTLHVYYEMKWKCSDLKGCQSNGWQTISVTSQFVDSQLGDVKSMTGVSQFGDGHNLSTNDIFRCYISRMSTSRKIYCRKYILAGVPAALALFRQ